jgi:hypothetical protein
MRSTYSRFSCSCSAAGTGTDQRRVDVSVLDDGRIAQINAHHLAVVICHPETGTKGDEITRLQRFLRELGQAPGAAAAPLFVAADRTCGWGWLPFRAAMLAAGVASAHALVPRRADLKKVGL